MDPPSKTPKCAADGRRCAVKIKRKKYYLPCASARFSGQTSAGNENVQVRNWTCIQGRGTHAVGTHTHARYNQHALSNTKAHHPPSHMNVPFFIYYLDEKLTLGFHLLPHPSTNKTCVLLIQASDVFEECRALWKRYLSMAGEPLR